MRTTVIGSYPLKFDQMGPEAIERAVGEQIGAGITLVSDGQTRSDMISAYAGVLRGTVLEGDKLRIRGRISAGDFSQFIDDFKLATKAAGDRAMVKGIITGPVTLVFSSVLDKGVYSGYRDRKLYDDVSSALQSLARALSMAGAKHFQIDEPYFSVGVPLDIAREYVEKIATSLEGEVALHVCGDASKIFDRLLDFRGVRVLSHAFAGCPENISLVTREKLESAGKLLGFGCIDTASERVETQDEVFALLNKGARTAGWENILVHPDCGMRALPLAVARSKLEAMGRAAARVQKLY